MNTINDDLLLRLVSKGLVPIAMNADFVHEYRGDIYRGCCGKQVNHAVILTGWSTDSKSGVSY